MKKQRTAIEYLIEIWPILKAQIPPYILEEVKEIEKQQIMDAFNEGEINSVDYFNAENITIEEAEQYYNETYK
jgi:hypothetical protein